VSKREASKRFFQTGELLFDRGDFLEAAKQFERAYAEDPLPAFLYNIGTAYDSAGDRKHAIEAYRKYIAGMPNVQDLGATRARLAVLERELQSGKGPAARPALPYVEPATKHTFSTVETIDGK